MKCPRTLTGKGVLAAAVGVLRPQEEALAGSGDAESELPEPGPASGDRGILGQCHPLAHLWGWG